MYRIVGYKKDEWLVGFLREAASETDLMHRKIAIREYLGGDVRFSDFWQREVVDSGAESEIYGFQM
jgi:hypothetical protein